MLQVDFKRIYLSYFLSTGEELKYEFLDGITFIYGENRSVGQEGQKNGVGKTAIFYDSLVFALYGAVSRKDVVKAMIPFNKGGKKKCIVELDLVTTEGDVVKNVKIRRTINPSKFELTVDGDDKSQSKSDATQEYLLNNILGGVKQEVFQQSIAMKIGSSTPFLSMGKPEREKFVGGVFDLTYLKSAEKLAREEYNAAAKETGERKAQLSVKEPQIGQLKNQIQTAQREQKERVEKKKTELAVIQKKIDNTEVVESPEEIDISTETEKYQKVLTALDTKISGLEREQSDYKQTISLKTQDNRNYEATIVKNEKAKVCPTCKRELDSDCSAELAKENVATRKLIEVNKTLITEATGKKEKLSPTIDEFKTKKIKVSLGLSKLNQKVTTNQQEIREYERQCRVIEELRNTCKRLELEIDEPEDSTILTTLLHDYKRVKAELTEMEETLVELEEMLEVLTSVKLLFGEKGIRSAILGRLVDIFNQNLNDYMVRLEAPYHIEFNSDFDYTLTTAGGVDVAFGSLSSGEALRVTTALAFTFKDIIRIQNQVCFNISIYDEWMDASICERGMNIIGDIIRDRHENFRESALIISHRKDLDIEGAHEVTVVKENGVSSILEQ